MTVTSFAYISTTELSTIIVKLSACIVNEFPCLICHKRSFPYSASFPSEDQNYCQFCTDAGVEGVNGLTHKKVQENWNFYRRQVSHCWDKNKYPSTPDHLPGP